jgi:hypothetical protein
VLVSEAWKRDLVLHDPSSLATVHVTEQLFDLTFGVPDQKRLVEAPSCAQSFGKEMRWATAPLVGISKKCQLRKLRNGPDSITNNMSPCKIVSCAVAERIDRVLQDQNKSFQQYSGVRRI